MSATPLSPSAVLENKVLAVLADPTSGLNANIAAVASQFQTTPPFKVPSFDFSGTAKTVFKGNISPKDAMSSGSIAFPALFVYTTYGSNTNRQKFQNFAGLVDFYARFLLSFKSARLNFDFESYANCIESAMFATLQNSAVSWGNCPYNGNLSFQKARQAMDAESWLIVQTFTARFEVII